MLEEPSVKLHTYMVGQIGHIIVSVYCDNQTVKTAFLKMKEKDPGLFGQNWIK